MLDEITKYLKEKIEGFSPEDRIIFNNRLIEINKNSFTIIKNQNETLSEKNEITNPGNNLTFIDGGQAEILSAGNFCLSFIRIGAVSFSENKKNEHSKKEFFQLTTAKFLGGELLYESKLFGDILIDERDLLISSSDPSIRNGLERASVSRIANIARRFGELSLAKEILSKGIIADHVVLDGTLETTFRNEEKYLPRNKISALAKSCSLFTASGNSPSAFLGNLGFPGCWSYLVDNKTFFVKLHPSSRHIFRFEGNAAVLPDLCANSSDAVFLGYPYGLVLADKLSRVSNEEKNSLRMRFLLDARNKEALRYLSTADAHDILDRLG